MMKNMLLKACINEFCYLQQNFILGDTNEKNRHHVVKWEIVTKSKEMGELALRKLDIMNKACILKSN